MKGLLPRLYMVCLLALTACAHKSRLQDPLTDLHNPALGTAAKQKAIDSAWQGAQAGTLDRVAVREDLKTIAWSRHWALELRTKALQTLLSDTDEKGREDTRNMVRLMLPRESEPRITAILAAAAEQNEWKETTPALVRSLSVEWIGMPDRDRPEARAIHRFHPADSLERVVYRVFRDPPNDAVSFGLVPVEKFRIDAWNVLRRLDPDGIARAALIADDSGGPAEDIKAATSELKVMPDTGEELAWLSSLRSRASPANRDWWSSVSRIVPTLTPEQTTRLRLRHLEPIRWASSHRSEWLASSREQLLSDLDSRLKSRKTYRRSAHDSGETRPPPESLADWRDSLSWGDALAILVIDEAIRHPGISETLFNQAAIDKDDKSAEYGGLLRAGPAETFEVVLFPPRPGARRGDNEFVASSDMFAQGDHALAHYHLHAQDSHNGSYAGPSHGDRVYAARHARNCIVFTWVSSRVLNADVYTPDGAVIDLGELSKP